MLKQFTCNITPRELLLLTSQHFISHVLCFSVNVIILVLLAVAFLIIVQRNLLNLSDFLHKENPGMFSSVGWKSKVLHAIYST